MRARMFCFSRSRLCCVIMLSASLIVQPSALAKSARSDYGSFSIFPETITLPASQGSHRVLVTGVRTNGLEDDLTPQAKFVSMQPEVASVTREGLIRARKPGATIIQVKVARQTLSVRVQVEAAQARKPLSFINDVLPVLSKAGC